MAASLTTEQLDGAIAAADAEIARLRRDTDSRLTQLREHKQALQAARRTVVAVAAEPAPRSGGSGAKRSTAKRSTAKRKTAAAGTAKRKTTAKQAGAKRASTRAGVGVARPAQDGVPYTERKEQVLKLVASSKTPVGTAEIAVHTGLTKTRARQLVARMLEDKSITAQEHVEENNRTRRIFAVAAKSGRAAKAA